MPHIRIAEKSIEILEELKRETFTRYQLEILQEVFQSLSDKTGEMLSHKDAEKEKL